jgi:hypothetical protein
MSDYWNDIGKVFKTTMNNNPGSEPVYQWADFEKRVIRSNFLRFNPASFNVYYLTMVFVFISLLGFSSYKAFNYNREIKKKDAIIRQYQRKELEIKIITYITDSINARNKINNNKAIVNPDQEKSADNLSSKHKIQKTIFDKADKKAGSDNVFDTITHITIKKKVVKKKLFIKKPQQVKDSIVIQ